jgi:hypothetical protein
MTMGEQTQAEGFTATERAVLSALKQVYPDGTTSADICGRENILLAHVARALNDLCARKLIDRSHTNSGVFYRLVKDAPLVFPVSQQPRQPESDDWVKCDVEGCGQEFSDATAMNIHKTKKHPEARERENVGEVSKQASSGSQQETGLEDEDLHIDVDLAEDALAKLSATVDLLRHLEQCEGCDLKDSLLVLLEDAVHQFFGAGLEPNSDPTSQSLKVCKRREKT